MEATVESPRPGLSLLEALMTGSSPSASGETSTVPTVLELPSPADAPPAIESELGFGALLDAGFDGPFSVPNRHACHYLFYLGMVVGRDAGEVLPHGGLVADGVEVLVKHGLLGGETFLSGS